MSFIRNRSHSAELQRRGTVKYLSPIVLMELWAGARTRKAERLLSQLQKPYETVQRIVTLNWEHYITVGQLFSDLAPRFRELCKRSDFVNDVQIAFKALSIGATLYTENISHFDIIRKRLKSMKLEYLTAS